MVGRSLLILTCLCLAWFIGYGCSGDPVDPVSPAAPVSEGEGLETSRAPLVKDFEPTSAIQGSPVVLHVHGEHFDEGSRVDLLLSGNPTAAVQTLSTSFVTSEELIANISIADSAPVGVYSVQVTTSGGKRGIPIEDFEVVDSAPSDPDAGSAPLMINAFLGTTGHPEVAPVIHASIYIYRGEEPVNAATVMVDGEVIPRADVPGQLGGTPGYYYVVLPPEAFTVGKPLVLEVRAGGQTVTATGIVPEAPVLTGPVRGSVFDRADPITIAWTSAKEPDGFEVWFDDVMCCGGFPALVGSEREFTIAASEIDHPDSWRPEGIFVGVLAVNEGSFTGPADPESIMRIHNSASPWTVVIVQSEGR